MKTKRRYGLNKKEAAFNAFLVALFSVLLCLISWLVFFEWNDTLPPEVEGQKAIRALAFAAIIFVFTVLIVIYAYFADNETLKSRKKMTALFVTATVSYTLNILISMVDAPIPVIYVAPVALCALLISLIVSPKLSFFVNFYVVLLLFIAEKNLTVSSTDAQVYYLLFSGILGSIMGTYMISKSNRRVQYLFGGLCIGFFSLIVAILTYFIFSETFNMNMEFWSMCLLALVSGLVDIALFFLLTPLFESIFNLVTDFRMAELASSDQPLMKRMVEEAPGTFNHSMLVASYAEACAGAIGADTFVARAAGYYHDIGKLKDPQFFVENQSGGQNPHESISPELSVMFIKKHIINGIALAQEYKLPEEIVSAIAEHHGTMPIRFFYSKAKRMTEGELDMKAYSYDGPKPTNKISAIIMIADASEAALRANNNKNAAAEIVDKIVKERFELEQFTDCDITMKDLEIIKRTILTTYLGITHDRIQYPEVRLGK